MLSKIDKLLTRLFIADKWNIGYLTQTPEDLIANQKLRGNITWLKEDSVDYAADPFIVAINNEPRVYYEELNFWKGKGEIMVIDNFDFANKKKVVGITPSSIHLSYPFLIQDDDKLFCIPETSGANEIGLYQVDVKTPALLIKQKVLIKGEPFVDSSVIYHQEKYWLFTSISGKNNELYIYHADQLDGDFKPHKQNPIKVEKNACRAAGSLFKVNNTLYRPTQNPVNRYGGSIVINEIKVLTEYEYQANEAFELMPDQHYNRGMHNISFANNMIVIDGKRKVFNVIMPLKKMIRNIRMHN